VNKQGIKIFSDKKKAGFAENYNVGMRSSTGNYVFVLNPDTILDVNCVQGLIEAFTLDPSIGCVSPKLLRMNENNEIYRPTIIDSAGMCLTKYVRHYDRGAGNRDVGQYENGAFVFGATGAAMMFKKDCLEDIKIDDEYFDEDFEFGREDADISWRLNNYGWKCLYWPKSIVYHVRTAKPGGRSNILPYTNMHSVKNRYLLLLNNISLSNYFRTSIFILLRDLSVICYVLLKEWSSIPAFVYLIANFRRLLSKRKRIQRGKYVDTSRFWFRHEKVDIQ
jgi:GT2 family glycosyltransferase